MEIVKVNSESIASRGYSFEGPYYPYKDRDKARFGEYNTRVIYMPQIEAGIKTSMDSLISLAESLRTISQYNESEGFADFEEKLRNGLKKDEVEGLAYVQSYINSVQIFKHNAKQMVVFPLTTDPGSFEFRDEKVKERIGDLISLKADISKMDQLESSINQRLDKLEIDDAANTPEEVHRNPLEELFSKFGVEEHTEPKEDEIGNSQLNKIDENIDQTVKDYLMMSPEYRRVDQSILSLESEISHPGLPEGTVSVLKPSVLFDSARISGGNMVELVDAMTDLRLPPMTSDLYTALTVAMICEIVLTKTEKEISLQTETSKKFQKCVYAILPVNISSRYIRLAMEEYSERFPRVSELFNAFNPQRKRNGFLGRH